MRIGPIIRDSSKAELKNHSDVKQTLQTDAVDVKNVCKGYNNVSERYKIFTLFNFIQLIFM